MCRPGFPLLYVNKAFEAVTGYPRREVVGRNCRFLQHGRSDPLQLARISDALRNALPCRAVVSNRRKDGSCE